MSNLNKEKIIEQLKSVYDPEFPLVDIYTLGLFYDIKVDKKSNTVNILMTFTTPSCPMSEMLQEMTKNAIREEFPWVEINIEITFDPMRKIDMIKDEDLQRMFM